MSHIDNYISIAEYAALHGVSPQAIKKKCQRGGYSTAKKIGRNWIIDKTEPFVDHRIKSGKYRDWRKKGECSCM